MSHSMQRSQVMTLSRMRSRLVSGEESMAEDVPVPSLTRFGRRHVADWCLQDFGSAAAFLPLRLGAGWHDANARPERCRSGMKRELSG